MAHGFYRSAVRALTESKTGASGFAVESSVPVDFDTGKPDFSSKP
jgi:hypothetical protein